MAVDLISTVRQMMNQTELPQEVFIDAIEFALLQAAEKRYGTTKGVSIELDPGTGEIRCTVEKRVVDIMQNYAREISIEEAQKLDPNAQLDDVIEVEADTKGFGRIEAQKARQILLQKIKEAERQQIFEEYEDRQGEIVTGYVQRVEKEYMVLELDRTEGILRTEHFSQSAGYRRGDALKCLILDVKNDASGGPQIVLSRTDKDLVVALFEMEVPEINEGLVEIKAIARDPGSRSKVAVVASDENLDPVGTCVGVRGSRVRAIVDELDGEKIELVRWNEDPEIFIANALQPAKVITVTLNQEKKRKIAKIIVAPDQLALAIGRGGQNAKLTSQLTGWQIDISRKETTDKSEADKSETDQPTADS